MSDYTYLNQFDGISGTIDGGDFHPHFTEIDAAIDARGKVADQTWTGTHTIPTLIVTAAITATGATANFTTVNAAGNVVAVGAVSGATLAGAADTTDITGGTF